MWKAILLSDCCYFHSHSGPSVRFSLARTITPLSDTSSTPLKLVDRSTHETELQLLSSGCAPWIKSSSSAPPADTRLPVAPHLLNTPLSFLPIDADLPAAATAGNATISCTALLSGPPMLLLLPVSLPSVVPFKPGAPPSMPAPLSSATVQGAVSSCLSSGSLSSWASASAECAEHAAFAFLCLLLRASMRDRNCRRKANNS